MMSKTKPERKSIEKKNPGLYNQQTTEAAETCNSYKRRQTAVPP